jgi:Family of unknown function (DUF6165)
MNTNSAKPMQSHRDDMLTNLLHDSLAPVMAGAVLIPVAVGELVDKITILEIKSERIGNEAKLANVRAELALLHEAWERHGGPGPGLDALIANLKTTNEALWQIEDDIRDCERGADFGPRFIELARAVYRHNDRRAELKRQINEQSGSAIIEEKSYASY